VNNVGVRLSDFRILTHVNIYYTSNTAACCGMTSIHPMFSGFV